MIKTSKQLKDKVRNISKSDSTKAQMLIRNYMMERFLERISLSQYRENFVLKGGMLVAALMGVETRSTMDIDTTVRSLSLTHSDAALLVENIISINVPDSVIFRVTKSVEIMEGHDYPGFRFMLEAVLDNMRQIIKIDISTGDIITPNAILFSYKLMFEDRTIPILAYNLETLLGEKLETIMTRSTANTRMRDFYDIHIVLNQESENLDPMVFKQAFLATCEKRKTTELIPQIQLTMDELKQNPVMQSHWESYKKENFYVGELEWDVVINSVVKVIDMIE